MALQGPAVRQVTLWQTVVGTAVRKLTLLEFWLFLTGVCFEEAAVPAGVVWTLV